MKQKVYLAIDLGASSGRVIGGVWDGSKIQLHELNRFPSASVYIPPYRHWDVLGIYRSILEGLNTAQQTYGIDIVSIGVDSWGVDYGLIDARGEMLSNPIHYRDERTQATFTSIPKTIGRETIYRESGIQFVFFNTIYQLAAELEQGRDAFLNARYLLFIPDLINYWLTGKRIQERTIASTSQLLNPTTGTWSTTLIDALALPPTLFREITEPGTPLGTLRPELAEKLRLPQAKVIAVPGHDTASAVAATPFSNPQSAFLSSGTWSIMGQELDAPNVTPEAMEAGFSNALGYAGTVRFLRNICGMWLIEESRRQWIKEGQNYTYDDIVAMASEAPARRAFIDPDDPEFASPGDMPTRITNYCRRTEQPVPTTPDEILRITFDSLVMKYRHVFHKLEELNGKKIHRLHIVGGGARNDFLNQMTADALNVTVDTGPVEATALGNIAVQMISDGIFPDLATARSVIRESFPPIAFEPKHTECWNKDEARFKKLLK